MKSERNSVKSVSISKYKREEEKRVKCNEECERVRKAVECNMRAKRECRYRGRGYGAYE